MPQYFAKFLTVPSTQLGSISTSATTVSTSVVINSSLQPFATQRRVGFISANATDFSNTTFTIVGTQEGGTPITEIIKGSTTGTTAWMTTQDFLTISSVTRSSQLNGTVTMINSTVGGIPWQPVNTCVTPTNIGFGLTYSSTAVGMLGTLEYSFDNPPGQGVQNPNSSWTEPFPITSTSLSTTANANTAGVCNIPIACWRVSMSASGQATSSQAAAYRLFVSALQAGLGSAN